MTGIDFVDTIVVRRTTNKGTTVFQEAFKPSPWAGKDFKKHEEERLKLAGDLWIIAAKGTKKTKLHHRN